MDAFIDIKVDGKYYIQRNEYSKIIEIDELNKKNKNFDNYQDLPLKVQKEIKNVINMKKSPEKYFEIIEIKDNKATITYNNNNDTIIENLAIPEYINGYLVTKLSRKNNTFGRMVNRIIMPETITELGSSLFSGNCYIEEVVLSPNIKIIPRVCFNDCNRLRRINLENIEEIHNSAFKGCKSLKNINLQNVEILEAGAFRECFSIEKISLPNIKELFSNVFNDCMELKEVFLGDKLKSLGSGAFENCTHLEIINLPHYLKEIEQLCFKKCQSLQSIKFPESLEFIGFSAFERSGLSGELTFSSNVMEICEFAFSYTNITKLNISKNTFCNKKVMDNKTNNFINIYDKKEVDIEK